MTARDRRLAQVLAQDPEVTNRLIQQGVYSVRYLGQRIGDRKHEFDKTWDWGRGEVVAKRLDLFRPAFDDESPNLYPGNTVRLWRELWQSDLDVRRDLLSPARNRRQSGYGDPPPDYKRALAE